MSNNIAIYMLTNQVIIKLYHWRTEKYSRHIASNTLYETLEDLIDRFIETLQGSRNMKLECDENKNIPIGCVDDNTIKKVLDIYKKWLSDDLPQNLKSSDTDLLNIRDEMIGIINKTLYLFTLD